MFTGAINQAFFTIAKETQIWDNILDRKLSIQSSWKKSGLNICSLVIYFVYKLLFKTKLRKISLTQKAREFKLHQSVIKGDQYSLSHESSPTEFTPEHLNRFNHYITDLISHFNTKIGKSTSYNDIRSDLHKYTLFILASIYSPYKINITNADNKFSL